MSKKRKNIAKAVKLIEKEKEREEITSETGNMKLIEDENKKLNEKIEELNEKLKEANDKLLRHAAETENAKKILKKDVEQTIEHANMKFVKELISVLDNFDRAVEALEKTDDKEKTIEGIKMIDKQFHQFFEKFNIFSFSADGEQFDPQMHEAISAVNDSGKKDGVVVSVYAKGYKMNDRIIRPAKVVVNKVDTNEFND